MNLKKNMITAIAALIATLMPLYSYALPANSQTDLYLPKLANKRVGLVVNHSSVVNLASGPTHLVDLLQEEGINVKRLFALEHGVRGKADAGEILNDSFDPKSGLPIASLYGKNKKPTKKMLSDLDVIVFDIQDVGVRFFTFISSLGLIMESAAENGVEVIVLDRPNPNSDYVAGAVLENSQRSFVGAFPIPTVYGLTIGELARMIKGEGWQASMQKLKLSVIPMKKFNRRRPTPLTIAPSPNLPTPLSVRLYPSLALFEPTIMSIGRGTPSPFTKIGAPDPKWGQDTFIPTSTPGAAKNPKHRDRRCYGVVFPETENLNQLLKIKYTEEYFDRFLKMKSAITNKDFVTSLAFLKLLIGTDQFKVRKRGFSYKSRFKRQNKKRIEAFIKSSKKYFLY